MGKLSWVVTLVPLFLAGATTIKAVFFGEDITETEAETIKYFGNLFVTWLIGSGAIGGAVSIGGKLSGNSVPV